MRIKKYDENQLFVSCKSHLSSYTFSFFYIRNIPFIRTADQRWSKTVRTYQYQYFKLFLKIRIYFEDLNQNAKI